MFDNPEVSLDALPSAENLEWQPLHGRYVRQLQVARLLPMLLLAAALGVAGLTPLAGQLPLEWLWLALLAVAAMSIAWPAISVPRCGYVLRDKDIVYRSGVAWHTVTAVPFNRIQHAETSSNPLDRRFGTATLELYTAGGSGGDLKIGGLPADTAERLREHVLKKIGVAVEKE